MKTNARLSEAYLNAKRLPLDDESKLVFFSDVHRGDNSLSDEFAHNQNTYYHALSYYLQGSFCYVEVGDGDELWEHGQFRHIRYAHSMTFSKLREFYCLGKMIMLYGNHNMSFKSKSYVEKHLEEYYDEVTSTYKPLFPGIEVYEALILEHRRTSGEIFVTHGHQGDLINDQLWLLTKYLNRHFWHYLHVVGFRNPASPAKNIHKRHKIEKNISRWIEKNRVMTMIGHTHRPKFAAAGTIPYFNTGSCVFPRHITCIEIADGQISLIDWRIKPNQSGALAVRRKVIGGPRKLTDCMYLAEERIQSEEML